MQNLVRTKPKATSLFSALLLIVAVVCQPSLAAENEDEILQAMKHELDRNFHILKKANPPVYFMCYRLTSRQSCDAVATDGSAFKVGAVRHSGDLQIEVRIGGHERDNTHPVKGSSRDSDRFVGMNLVPLEGNSADVLKRNLWLETEKAYRSAAAQYGNVMAEEGLSTEEDKCDDFSREKPVSSVVTVKLNPPDIKVLVENTKSLSEIYKHYDKVEDSWVSAKQENIRKYLVNTEGTAVADGQTTVEWMTAASSTAQDGERVTVREASYFRSLDDALAAKGKLQDLVKEVARTVTDLTKAPLAEPFCGPAMLKGAAAAVMFHEVLGHRLEASRHRQLTDGKTFAKMLNSQILPTLLSVYDRPTLDSLNGTKLVGHYKVDDEGVRAQDVTLVKDGKLVGFLLNRTPVPSFGSSNGHGRCDGAESSMPMSRMANLIIESSKTVPEKQLRDTLLAQAKKQGKPYGLLIEKVDSGVTWTSSYTPQTFQVYPSVVKRVYVDGRPDELVRGVRIVGTPLAALQRIIQTADTTEVFNGTCGAQSGWVHQANCSPAILIDYLETERRPPIKGIAKILPPPEKEELQDE